MCGIAGIVHCDGSKITQQELDTMTDALAHRGPDARGTVVRDNVGFGHRRLSIQDVSNSSSQPMQSADGSVSLIFNGEIYNFREKRTELEAKGYTFTSAGDTEVLLKLYEEYGSDCLKHLRGMFAFAIHDRKKSTVFIARDRAGQKPLKYFCNGSTFAFASEIKALKTLKACPRAIDYEAVHHFLSMTFLPAPLTGIQGIQKLPPGHTLSIDLRTGKQTIQKYWELHYEIDRHKTVQEWEEEILNTLKTSVALRMIADVPLGAFLSGGIDSAAIVALMSQICPEPIKTFSIGSESDPHNELTDAEHIATLFGTQHHPIALKPDIVTLLPELVRTYEEPLGDPSVIPTYLISRETQKHVTVALSGDGGDENFAGYLRYPLIQFSEAWGRAPQPFHRIAKVGTSALHTVLNNTFSYRCTVFQNSMNLPWEQRLISYMGSFTDAEKNALYGEKKTFENTGKWFAHHTENARERGDDLIHKAMNMELETYLADDLMPKVDMGAMAHSLEVRSPFLDHLLLEMCATIPSQHKLKHLNTKWILKKALKDIVPEETIRKKKRGFRLPLNAWFRNDLKPFLQDTLMSNNTVYNSIVDRKGVEQFLNKYFESNIDYSPQLWMLLWLSEWCNQQSES